MLSVKAYIGTQIAHVSQLLSGLAILERAGKITIQFEKDSQVGKSSAIQRLEVDDRRLVFDLADGFQISHSHYDSCDRYLKRMLSPEVVAQYHKVRPYGLNYPVNTIGDQLILRSIMSGDYKFALKNLVRRSDILSWLLNPNLSYRTSQVHHFEAQHGLNEELRVIYFTRLWNPANVKNKVHKEQRESMNALRRDLVTMLRQ